MYNVFMINRKKCGSIIDTRDIKGLIYNDKSALKLIFECIRYADNKTCLDIITKIEKYMHTLYSNEEKQNPNFLLFNIITENRNSEK